MLRSNVQMGNFVSQLKILLMSMIVKRDKLAAAFDTSLEYRKAADKYINTIDNGDKWESYVKFDRDVLLAAGLDVTMISYYMANKENIPRAVRQKVIDIQRQYIIDNYVEMNDYYLMLHGEPPIEDDEAHAAWVEEQQKDERERDPKIVDPYIMVPENTYGVPTDVPIHKLSIEYINTLESTGILDQIKADYPNKTYLNYLGRRSIDYYTSRTTDNFGIMYVETKEVDNVIRQDFILAYDKARAYYMMGYYNREYSNMFLWYDEFIGLLILIMAVQRLVANIFKQGLTRDFYDVNLIKYLFKSYSIPYIEELDIRYQRILAKNLNYLLQYKATDKVLYDVAYLLGFYDVNVYKYYLIKTHVLNDEGLPVFEYKTIRENGETKRVPDYEKMYRFHFQQVNLKEDDVVGALVDDRNKHRYEDIVGGDPYWVEDSDLKDKLYETDFNQMISKYMSLDVTVKKVEMMYEVAHTLRAVIDNQQDFRKIMINIPSVSEMDISLYDAVILLCALGAKKLGLPGTIPLKGYQIANVYGFNYTQDIDALKDAIYDTKDLEAGEILFAQDTQTFYEVHKGEIVKIPNHFRNQFVSDTTLPTVDVSKDTFRPLTVKWVRDNSEIDVQNMYYKYLPPTTPVYKYTDSGWDIITAASLDRLDNLIVVKAIPDTGDKNKRYIKYTDGNFGYWNGVNIVNRDVTFVSTIGYNLIDNGLAQFILHMRAVTERDLGVIYTNIRTLRLFITKMLAEVHDKDVYYQYSRLYKALLVTEDVQKLYLDTNGNPQATYESLLANSNGTLYSEYERIISIPTDIDNTLNSIFSRLGSYAEYKFLPNVNRINSMFDIVMRLIRFFKSYTVDFVNSGVRYIFDDRYLQCMKLMDELVISGSFIELKDQISVNGRYYKDLMERITAYLPIDDKMVLEDTLATLAKVSIWDRQCYSLHDTLIQEVQMDNRESIPVYDDLSLHGRNMLYKSDLKLRDALHIEVKYANED